eukprot:4554546-Pyramimonas_sp.AAC.2
MRPSSDSNSWAHGSTWSSSASVTPSSCFRGGRGVSATVALLWGVTFAWETAFHTSVSRVSSRSSPTRRRLLDSPSPCGGAWSPPRRSRKSRRGNVSSGWFRVKHFGPKKVSTEPSATHKWHEYDQHSTKYTSFLPLT